MRSAFNAEPVSRRHFLASVSSSALCASFIASCAGMEGASSPHAETGESRFGTWREQDGLPEFVYTVDQTALPEALWDPIARPPTRRHFHMMGNRAIQALVTNTGDVGLYDESEGMRWLVYCDDSRGTGHSIIEDGGTAWGSSYALRPPGRPPERVFGATYFTVTTQSSGLTLVRTVLCPEGEKPWLLIRVDLTLDKSEAPRRVVHREEWRLRPRFLKSFQDEEARDKASLSVRYAVSTSDGVITATEQFTSLEGVHGGPATLALEALSPPAETTFSGAIDAANDHPVLNAHTPVLLSPGETTTLWFRFGRFDATPDDVQALWSTSFAQLSRRLPRARSGGSDFLEREIMWHAAALTGGANRDAVLGGHTLNQGSLYAFGLGANAAARDSLQHALPLIYIEPDLALSVLRNTCAWGSPDGDLPYALTGDKMPLNNLFRPSDQNLWALWLAAEYAAATGDLAAFSLPQSYHPQWKAEQVTLKEHLVRQYRFFTHTIGRGEAGHVRILNADWNDMALELIAGDRDAMIKEGSSVLNSAMASWVLSIFAGLMDRLGEMRIADNAREQSAELRTLVAASWNGRWFDRAYAPGGRPLGRDRCWLEVQPWAILCGAATDEQAHRVLETIDLDHRRDSPLGARIIWPPNPVDPRLGEGTRGGVWYSINMTLIWAAAKLRPAMAWDEWRRMSLANHSAHYSGIWEGTLSGPDSWNAPEAKRPGQTWSTPAFSMQSFPVANMHSHSQPILSYLRLLGVVPNIEGGLDIKPARGNPPGEFRSQNLSLEPTGEGWLRGGGPTRVSTRAGRIFTAGRPESAASGTNVMFSQ